MDKEGIERWLKECDIFNYTINDDLSVDVNGNVSINNLELSSIPFKFDCVSGDFVCMNNKLTSLEGCPEIIGGHLNWSKNNIRSLEGCPVEIRCNFNCVNNNHPH